MCFFLICDCVCPCVYCSAVLGSFWWCLGGGLDVGWVSEWWWLSVLGGGGWVSLWWWLGVWACWLFFVGFAGSETGLSRHLWSGSSRGSVGGSGCHDGCPDWLLHGLFSRTQSHGKTPTMTLISLSVLHHRKPFFRHRPPAPARPQSVIFALPPHFDHRPTLINSPLRAIP